MFEIATDRTHTCLRMRLWGLWTPDHLRDFDQARRRALKEENWRGGDFVCLVDLREHGVQSKEVANGAQAIINAADVHPRKLAFLVDRALARMQATRINGAVASRAFVTEAEAELWLFSDSN